MLVEQIVNLSVVFLDDPPTRGQKECGKSVLTDWCVICAERRKCKVVHEIWKRDVLEHVVTEGSTSLVYCEKNGTCDRFVREKGERKCRKNPKRMR